MSNPIRAQRGWNRSGRRALVLALALLLVPGAERLARADLIFMNDGFVLQGRVIREGVTEIDSGTREAVFIPKGHFMIDDGPRRIVFSPTQVRVVERMAVPAEESVISKGWQSIVNPQRIPPIVEILETEPWDAKWDRHLFFRSPTTPRVKVKQHLVRITPYFASMVATTRFDWVSFCLTRELGPEAVDGLLKTHPDFAETGPKLRPADIAARRLRKIDFFAQAGWFDEADGELTRLLTDQPAQQAKVEAARSALNRMRSREQLEVLKRWHLAGRHDAVRKGLAKFPEKGVPEEVRTGVRELRNRYARTDEKLKQAKRLLALNRQAAQGGKHQLLATAATTLANELHFDNVDRLGSFLSQALQAERQRGAKRKPSYDSNQLLALAVTGWLLGSSSAEARPDFAANLWLTRDTVLRICQVSSAADREGLLATYLRTVTPRVELDEIAQLIPNLPPPEPAKDMGTDVVAVKLSGGGGTYHLKLPPEYTHNRAYPVLFVLHRSGEKATTMLERWSAAAAERGYILVAPEWEEGNGYTYSEGEHQVVLKALRDLRQRFRVDSDRVFLFGLADGGKMAFDVGLSHPDMFAGILPMAAGPAFFPSHYWRNAQYLPIYAVNGTRAGDSSRQLKERFNDWVLRGFPALWIEYKNRGQEWFAGELPNMLDWMDRQRRVFPLHQLGSDGGGGKFGNEFCSLRTTDNRFYWLGGDIKASNTNSAKRWRTGVSPATFTGRIDPEKNEIFLKTAGLNEVVIRFGRNSRGNYMIDFEKPVTVKHGFAVLMNAQRITPSLAVLMADLAERGDRQHLFLAERRFILVPRRVAR